MARRVDAAPLLRHLGLAATPTTGPGLAPEPFPTPSPGPLATTSKARPKEPARRSSSSVSSPGSSRPPPPAGDQEVAAWWRVRALPAALREGQVTSPVWDVLSDTSSVDDVAAAPLPSAPPPSAVPLPRLLPLASLRPPPLRPPSFHARPRGPPPHAPPAWPRGQPGLPTLPRPAFGGRKAAPARAREGLTAKFALPPAVRPRMIPPSRPLSELRGPPHPPHVPTEDAFLRRLAESEARRAAEGVLLPLPLEAAESVRSLLRAPRAALSRSGLLPKKEFARSRLRAL